ncbi:MAG: hypothetical protein IPL67_01975 [Ignavibacteria bacterium]|nr:hypothetical protein [Ignavibacteria bacterium]
MKEKISRKELNEQIRAPQVRVVDEDGNSLGVMTNSDALSILKVKRSGSLLR